MPPRGTLRLVGPAGATCGPASICCPVLTVLRIVQGVGPLAGREALDDAATRNAAARSSFGPALCQLRLCRSRWRNGSAALRLRLVLINGLPRSAAGPLLPVDLLRVSII